MATTPSCAATRADFNPFYGGAASDQTKQAWLEKVWRALFSELPTLADRLVAGEVEQQSIVDVVVSATLRILRNPGGVTEGGGGLDDYTETYKYADFTEDVYFTAAELRRLSDDVDQTASWSGSLRYC